MMICKAKLTAVMLAVTVLFWPGPLTAAEPTAADLLAMVRVLSFVESLPKGEVVVGVVYASPDPEAFAQATALAERLTAAAGSSIQRLRAVSVGVTDLHSVDRLHALVIMPGIKAEDAPAIVDAVRSRHLVSFSTDPACGSAQGCVVSLRAEPVVEVLLDTTLADAAGVKFSPIFVMMVKRR